MNKTRDKLLFDCCERCQEFDADKQDFSECQNCPILKLYKKYKSYRKKAKEYEPYYKDAIWGPSDCIGDSHEMGSF